jgi:AAA domain/TIR domain
MDPDGPNPLLSASLFVGRDRQLSRIAGLLRQGQSTLLIGGRRAGKTTLLRRLSAESVDRSLVVTDVAGWDLSSESTALGALLGAIEGRPETAHAAASRGDVVDALAAVRPLALVIDEADRLLLASWGGGFYAFLRWLDDTHLRTDISIVLVGGPVLVLFRDPEDRGSPPLNTAELRYLEPLDRTAVAALADIASVEDHDRVLDLGGGQAWLTTRMLAEAWEGTPLNEAADTVFDRALGTFQAWERQLGPDGRALLRRFPPHGLPRSDLRRSPWSRYREAAKFAHCIGALRIDRDRLCLGPRLFTDWLTGRDPDELVWDIAISYASEDEALARQINAQLHRDFTVFFAPDQAAGLWGTDLARVLPNTYGVQSRSVLVLCTSRYVAKHWTRVEFDSVAAHH